MICIKCRSYFDLDRTLNCGQCFRWYKKSDYWLGTVKGHLAMVRVKNECLEIESTLKDENFWKFYFDTDFDYDNAQKNFYKLGFPLNEATKENHGIHILNQDHWEALCSFIISQNNNIPRIKLIIERLCKCFGDYNNGCYSFPSPKVISSLNNIGELSAIKAGFRAKYILNSAKYISDSKIDLKELEFMKSEEAIDKLQIIKGVGPKIASCTMLYGYHRLDCFPIDTWIRKILKTFSNSLNYEKLGDKRGLAQIYLFNWSRSHPEYFS